jgi:acetoin utilization protein AcuB
MIVRNWMKRDPVTVPSDTLVSKAERIMNEHNLRALPVADDGRLRGVMTRIHCMRAAEYVARTEDPHEFAYFVNRLKVKDLMVRNPRTVNAGDTMESCLRRGQEENIGQYPVLEDGKVTGLISATEVFSLAAHILGVWEAWSGITIGPIHVENGTMGKIITMVADTGAVLESIFAVRSKQSNERIRVIVRFTGVAAETVAAAAVAHGFPVMELCRSTMPDGEAAATPGS